MKAWYARLGVKPSRSVTVYFPAVAHEGWSIRIRRKRQHYCSAYKQLVSSQTPPLRHVISAEVY